MLGALLRFAYLGAYEMSADEGASWAAAVQPSYGEVLRAQRHLNPAELGLHDVTLHYWMHIFGDSVTAMRALSALAGTIAIALTFFAARELPGLNGISDADFDYRDTIAALAALIFAANLITIKYARELRMYPLMLALVLAQAACFLLASHGGGSIALISTIAFTALAIAAHPMALLVFASEGVWLSCLLIETRMPSPMRPPIRSARGLIYPLAALAAGVIIAGIIALPLLASTGAANDGLLNWVASPPLWAPFALFNKGTGSVTFPVLAAAAAWGVICGWRRMRSATLFLLLWMWLPPLSLIVLSYAVRPVFVERYLITSFVPFFILAAVGIMELPSNVPRAAAAILVVILSLAHTYAWSHKPHDTQWREGLRLALASDRNGQPISVAPGYAVNVARYYLPSSAQTIELIEADSPAANGDVLLLSDQSKGNAAVKLASQYPRIIARIRGLQIRGR